MKPEFKRLIAAAFGLCFAAATCPEVTVAATPSLTLAGAPETIFNWSKDACDKEDIPDAPSQAFRDATGRIQLVAGNLENRRFVGADLNHVKYQCKPVMLSARNRNPSLYSYLQWLVALYTLDGKTIYAIVHDEFHGSEISGECPSRQFFPCWLGSTTEFISTDEGASYHPIAAPPANLVATIPDRYQAGIGPVGVEGGTNILRNPKDGYFYRFANSRTKFESFPNGPLLMRTNDLADPHSWRAWDGDGFNVKFIDPYTQDGTATFQPIAGVGNPSSVTFNSYLNKFLMIGMATTPDPTMTKVYYAVSQDLIHWTPQKSLFAVPWNKDWKCGDVDPVAYPSALDPESSSRNFDETGRRFYIYYTRLNFSHTSDCRHPDVADRDLVRVPVSLTAP